MATRTHNTTDDENGGTTGGSSSTGSSSRSTRSGGGTGSGRSRTGGGSSGRASALGGAAAGLSAATIMDIVERLGLIDMIVDRVKARIEEVDADQLIDDLADYLRKNPEVLVVALGAVTIASGALVYLNRRK